MRKATISSKGQSSIPKAIRERLNLKPGTQVALDVQGEQVVIKRLVSGELAKERASGLACDDARFQSS